MRLFIKIKCSLSDEQMRLLGKIKSALLKKCFFVKIKGVLGLFQKLFYPCFHFFLAYFVRDRSDYDVVQPNFCFGA